MSATFQTVRVVKNTTADADGKRAKRPRRNNGDAGAPLPDGAGFDVAGVCDSLSLYWLNGTDRYFRPAPDGRIWLETTAADLRRKLKTEGIATRPADGSVCGDLDRCLVFINERRALDYAGSLAGWSAGVYQMGESRVLVKDSPRIIEPGPGDWPTVRGLVEGLLKLPGCDQTPYFYGWLKVAYESLRAGERRHGQALVLVGPSDCGKSRLQHHVITPLLGNRSADPASYMFGRSDFNAELAGAEHLLIEDPPSATDIQSRLYFGERLKAFAVNDASRIHRKNRDAASLPAWWRLSVSLNDDPEKLKVLPPLSPDLRDKLMLLKAQRCEEFWAQFSAEEDHFAAFRDRIAGELPAFASFLLGYEIPADIRARRFGVEAFQHPEIWGAVYEAEPESVLCMMIDAVIFAEGRPDAWGWGSSLALEKELKAGEYETEARKLFSYPTACGVYLRKLAGRFPDRFESVHKRTGNLWLIRRAPAEESP